MPNALSLPRPTADISEARQNAHRTAIFLSKIASLFTSQRFHRYLERKESRFQWTSHRIFDRLHAEFFMQVKQGINVRISEDIAFSQQLFLTSAVIEAEVKRLTDRFGLKLRKSDCQFTVPRAADYEGYVLALCQSRPPAPINRDKDRPFYLWNTVDSLVLYVKARRTLSTPTGHGRFDELLSSLEEDYLLSGFPHDLLVHDADAVTNPNRKVTGLLLHNEFCSTWPVEPSEGPQCERENSRLVDLT